MIDLEKVKMAVIGNHFTEWPENHHSDEIVYDMTHGTNEDEYTVNQYFEDWHRPTLAEHLSDIFMDIDAALNHPTQERTHPKLIQDLKEIVAELEQEAKFRANN